MLAVDEHVHVTRARERLRSEWRCDGPVEYYEDDED
jgi:hypothetical protein